ncbi:hypothetical protein [Maribacter sp.]|uniref:hypothetical protein n=1 Tax=Maribacter sp. TaxID=1897614 RepID=UPI00329A333B
MKLLITFLLLFMAYNTTAQVAIINDKDGFTNVRKVADATSEVIYKLKNNQVFWYGQEDYHSKGVEWIMIEIPKNDFSIECGSLNNLYGYVHKSRIQPINTLAQYKEIDVQFLYDTKPFSEEDKIIDYQNNHIVTINGLYPRGTNGNKPKTETEKLTITIKGIKIDVPQILISDIYECTNDFNIYKNEETYFAHQWNSDGAGAYEIVWVITDNEIKQRLVGTVQ